MRLRIKLEKCSVQNGKDYDTSRSSRNLKTVAIVGVCDGESLVVVNDFDMDQ